MLLLWIIFFSILGSVGAIIAAASLLSFKQKTRDLLIPCFIAYSTGTLLAAGILGLLNNAIIRLSPLIILPTFLGGIVIFFLLEKLIIWRHCHKVDCEVHGVAGPMIIFGDAFHNFIDGVVIAGSFLISIPFGIAIGISVIGHEIPQEMGDFAILLNQGYSKRKALSLNLLSSISTLPAGIIGYFALDLINIAIPFVMALSAASFIYIALVDLTPEMHNKTGMKHTARQFLLMLAGIGTIIIILLLNP